LSVELHREVEGKGGVEARLLKKVGVFFPWPLQTCGLLKQNWRQSM
jgi:hypothetical protein